MSLRESFSIIFSRQLDAASSSQKRDALVKLLEYIEKSPDIPDVSADGEHILDTIYLLVVELLEEGESISSKRVSITERSLTRSQEKLLRVIGFDLYRQMLVSRDLYVAA